MLIARFDGACEPKNPGGHGACACVIERDGFEIYRKSEYLGYGPEMTNNVAEYQGLMLILKWYNKRIAALAGEHLHIIGDSMIVIRRMTGKSRKPPVGICAPLARDCVLAAQFNRPCLSFEWQGRDNNEECDAMCSLEIENAILELAKV